MSRTSSNRRRGLGAKRRDRKKFMPDIDWARCFLTDQGQRQQECSSAWRKWVSTSNEYAPNSLATLRRVVPTMIKQHGLLSLPARITASRRQQFRLTFWPRMQNSKLRQRAFVSVDASISQRP